MKVYPAIDIKDGQCVRLIQGEMNKSTEYGSPLEMAKRWETEGANYLHVVDLDAAFLGEFVNKDTVTSIVKSIKIPVQMGGGVRTKEDIRQRLDDVGISRVILGTSAVENPELLEWALSKYGSRIVVGVDAKNGKVAINGWAEGTDIEAIEFARRVHDMGAQSIIYTDISRDGLMQGPNIENTGKIVKQTWMNLIASGGISSLDDIKKVKGTGACGCVIGQALYAGAFTLQEAMQAAK
jgi:phosphoribosylformimino-5-aminoimidazole carboxamide ribotide isomerase